MLHVLPSDVARGAQVYARSLRLELDDPEFEHRTMTIFESSPVALHADVSVGAKTGWLRPLDPIAVLRLRLALRRWNPDLLIAHGGEALKYLFCSRIRKPMIYYAIGVVAAPARRGLRKWFHKALYSSVDMIAAVSRETRDELQEQFGVPPVRLSLIPNGRAATDYVPREDRGEDLDQEVTLIFVGHVTASKRPDWFIRLAERLRSEGRMFEAQLVGDGPLQQTLVAAAEKADVTMLGRRDDVPTLLSRADIFVFPSLVEGEGMPGVLIEAALAGLPIVATNVPGASTVIDHASTGFVVEVDDFEALVKAIIRLMDDRGLRNAMGKEARKRAMRDFSLEASVQNWRELIGTVLRD